ncbi:MAG TPA: methyltransferase domain-containing protein [Gemmataceae bacterium]|nr:methyltransferase domain-containing protein [Gemmataceae bacterium]
MTESIQWDDRYRTGDTPWDSGRPSAELLRTIEEIKLQPCQAIDLGCGTGTNVIHLAKLGFSVTGLDISPLAAERARRAAAAAGVNARFLAADLLRPPPEIGGPYDFFFDRGCYHAVRRGDVNGYLKTLEQITAPGSLGLVLAGNAREPMQEGPPVVTEEEIRSELGRVFEIVRLREFRFDTKEGDKFAPLAWSCLLRRVK